MRQPAVIIGVGQMGGVFARGFLRIGHPVFPILRGTSIEASAPQIADPSLVLVAVGENDLDQVLRQMPQRWKGSIGLLQNELLPGGWEKHGIENPTVIAVWFEKKFRSPITPLIASPIYGPHAELVAQCLTSLDVPVEILDKKEDLVSALVMKNLYILTANIAGLQGSDTVGSLLEEDLELTEAVFDDVLALQEKLTGVKFDRETMWQKLQEIFRTRPDHGSRGRSAANRLQRALAIADRMGTEVPRLRQIAVEVG